MLMLNVNAPVGTEIDVKPRGRNAEEKTFVKNEDGYREHNGHEFTLSGKSYSDSGAVVLTPKG